MEPKRSSLLSHSQSAWPRGSAALEATTIAMGQGEEVTITPVYPAATRVPAHLFQKPRDTGHYQGVKSHMSLHRWSTTDHLKSEKGLTELSTVPESGKIKAYCPRV